jgi:pre-mRNA-splicing factor CDC5/CEF1
MQHDSLAHSIPGTAHLGGTLIAYEPLPDLYVATAKEAVYHELAGTLGFPDAPEEQVRNAVCVLTVGDEAAVDESTLWVHMCGTLVLDAMSSTWVPADQVNAEACGAGYKAILKEHRSMVAREAGHAVKVEKKLGVVLGGYVARADELGR